MARSARRWQRWVDTHGNLVSVARISVVGTSGSGKTTVGRRVAELLDVDFVELDSIRHQAGWNEMPDDQFRQEVGHLVLGDAWVVDGGYESVLGESVRSRATEVIWVDPRRPVLMAQVIWRSLIRAALRKELWNGNREHFRTWLEPDHPIRWAWATAPERRLQYERLRQVSDVPWARLRSRREIRRYLAGLPGRA